jgi:alanine racemase
MKDRAWIEVDLGALVHNAGVLRRAIPTGTQLGLMVKANGYGHGMVPAARAALAGGADRLMVVSIDEAVALREAGIVGPILIVYPTDKEAIGEAVGADLEVSVSGRVSTRPAVEGGPAPRAAGATGPLRLHIEVDTGMGRGGVAVTDLDAVVRMVDDAPGTEIVGIWTHLADGMDPERSAAQIARYEAALDAITATGRALPMRHVGATEGVFLGTSPTYDMVRVGLGFYGTLGEGIHAAGSMAALATELRPAMTVGARPVRLETMPAGSSIGYGHEWTAERESRIATIPIGYADGWTRTSWPGTSALVCGRRVPLVGRVSMDSVCADVTDVPEATMDDEMLLLGVQGGERITVDEIAAVRRTVSNEVFCAFGTRPVRRFVDPLGLLGGVQPSG